MNKLNLKDLIKKVNDSSDICVFADREIIKELILGLCVEENKITIDKIEWEDDTLLFSKIDNLFIIESPFSKIDGKLKLIEAPHVMIEDEIFFIVNYKNEEEQISTNKLEIFKYM